MQAPNRDAGRRIFRHGGGGAVDFARGAVFRGEDRGDIHSRLEHEIDAAASREVQAGVVGDEPDSLARERREVLRGQHVESGLHLPVPRDHTADTDHGFVIASERQTGRVQPYRGGDDGRHTGAQGRDGRPGPGVHAVG